MAKRWFSAAAVAGLALALGSSPSMAAPEPLTDGELDLVVAAGVEADIEALQQALLEDVIIPHLRQVQARLAGYDLALHDQIGQLIDAAAQEVDEPTRAGQYAELQRLLFDDPMWIIAAQEGVAVAHRDHVQGFVHNPLWPRPNVRWNYFDK